MAQTVFLAELRPASPSSATRANLLNYSERFDEVSAGGWGNNSNNALTANDVVAPDGSLTGDKFQRTAAPAAYRGQNLNKTAAVQRLTYSMHAKRGVGDYVSIRIQGTYPARVDLVVNLLTGAVHSLSVGTGFSLPEAYVEVSAQGFLRISVTADTDATAGGAVYFSFNKAGGHVDATDSDALANGWVWGAQVELAPAMSDYIRVPGLGPEAVTDFPTQVLRFSSSPNWTRADGSNWLPMLDVPYRRNTQVFEGDFQRQSQDYGELEFAISKGQSVLPLTSLLWDGRAVRIWKGQTGQNTAQMTLMFEGTSEKISGDRSRVVATLKGPNLDVPLLTSTYAGTGSAEGPSDLKSAPKPMLLGTAMNLEPVYVNRTLGIFQYHAYGAAGGVTVVYDSGSQLGATIGDYASYALLAAAAVPAGRFATCNALGMGRHGGDLTGILTIDAQGAISGGLPGAIMKWVLRTHLALPLSRVKEDSLDWLDGQIPHAQDIYVSEQVSVGELCSSIMLSLGGYTWFTEDGRFTVGLIRRGGATAATLNSLNIAPTPRFRETTAPVWKRSQGWGRSWRVHSYSEVRTPREINPRGTWSGAPSPVYQYYDQVEWANSSWIYVSSVAGSVVTPGTDPAVWLLYRQNGAPIVDSATTPTDPVPGLLWRNSTNGQLRSYIGGTWVLTSDVTSQNTAAAIVGQGSGATANNLTGLNPTEGTKLGGIAPGATVGAAVGVNRVPFSLFENTSTSAWYTSAVSGVSAITLTYALSGGYNDATYAATAAGVGSFGSLKSAKFAVTPSEVLAVSARLSTNSNTKAKFTLRYFDSTGTAIAAQPVVIPTGAGGGDTAGPSTPLHYLFQGLTTAPNNAFTVEIEVFLTSLAAGAISATLTQPMVAGGEAGQTTIPNFTRGPNSFDAADVTSSIVGVSEIVINADYLGAPTTALPRTQPFALVQNGTDVTTLATWSISVVSGTITATVGAATGILSLSLNGGVLTTSTVRLTAVYGPTTRTFDVKVTKLLAAAPSGGSGGGTSASAGISGVTTSTSMVAVGPELTITLGSGGTATLSADYSYTTGSTSGAFSEYAQWYRWNGSAYVAIGTEVQADTAYVASLGDPGFGELFRIETGLAANSSQKFKLYMRNNTGTVQRTITGSCAAVGS